MMDQSKPIKSVSDLNKDKFKIISKGITCGDAFSTIIRTMEEKVAQNPSIDMSDLEYNNLFRNILHKVLLSPNEDTMIILLLVAIIIAICGEDVKPLTIAQCSLIEMMYPNPTDEITQNEIDRLNARIEAEWNRLTTDKFVWSKDTIKPKE